MPDLHDRFDTLFDDEPQHRPLDVHLANGHRALRRRRLSTGAAALAVMTVIGGGAYAVQGDPDKGNDRDTTTVASQTPDTTPSDPNQQIVETCHEADGRNGGTKYLWRGGAPEVMASIVTYDGNTRAYLRSGNQKFWGECYIDRGSSEAFVMPAYRIAPDPQISNLGYGYGVGQACDPDRDVVPGCGKFVATHEGRRDPAVARVEVRFFDGKWEKVDANEGYYYVEHVGTLPDDITWAKDGMPLRNGQNIDDVINRIKLFDADGTLIAYWDASQNRNGINAPNDAGVGELEDYPMIQSKLAGPDGDRNFPG
ncbi:hypothetical protein [Nocardioides sp. Root151]|uniref:hypothetical protein n=1 Tax=Nocardioides sp. Root151 TaxID=1736475 RepID=UPI0007032F22|nr:hypothetical protein [Nocardioides sp. Root151]KQZ66763.1 hypothetical protein ASD66_17140 [Nocardioides sp. Root151]